MPIIQLNEYMHVHEKYSDLIWSYTWSLLIIARDQGDMIRGWLSG